MEHAEEWRPIDGYEGVYEVSNLGRVRSLWFGRCRILSAADNGCGYLLLTLRIHGKPKTFCVHRLVAVAFIPRVSDDFNQVNHINMDRKDNRAENLEWTTQAQNVMHANSLRKCKRLTDTVILGIAVDVITLGRGTQDTVRKWGVYAVQVRDIKSGRRFAKKTAHLRT